MVLSPESQAGLCSSKTCPLSKDSNSAPQPQHSTLGHSPRAGLGPW